VRLEQLVVGLGQAVGGHVRGGGDAQSPIDEEALDGQRQHRDDGVAGLVDRFAVDVLGQHVGTAAHRDEGGVCDPRRLDGDVGRRVADAEHEDPLAREDVRLAVVVHVDLLAAELLGPRESGFGPTRVPVVPVGDEDGAIAIGLLVAVSVGDGHLPLPLDRLRAEDLGAEANLLAEAEVIDVFVEIGGHLEVVRVVRIVIRHRQRLEGHHPPRGVDVQRAVRRRHPVVVFEAPVPPDLRALLKAVERNPACLQNLAGDDAGGARPDDADLRGGGHGAQSI
jgi:hypothetical protein